MPYQRYYSSSSCSSSGNSSRSSLCSRYSYSEQYHPGWPTYQHEMWGGHSMMPPGRWVSRSSRSSSSSSSRSAPPAPPAPAATVSAAYGVPKKNKARNEKGEMIPKEEKDSTGAVVKVEDGKPKILKKKNENTGIDEVQYESDWEREVKSGARAPPKPDPPKEERRRRHRSHRPSSYEAFQMAQCQAYQMQQLQAAMLASMQRPPHSSRCNDHQRRRSCSGCRDCARPGHRRRHH